MNSENNMLTCLPPRSTDQTRNSHRPHPHCLPNAKKSWAATAPRLPWLLLAGNVGLAELLRVVFEMWGFQPAVAHLGGEASRLLEDQDSVWPWWTLICPTRPDLR